MNEVKITTKSSGQDAEGNPSPFKEAHEVYLNGEQLSLVKNVHIGFDADTKVQTVTLTLIANTQVVEVEE